LDEVVTIAGRKQKIMAISDAAKQIIKLWIKAAKLNLEGRMEMKKRDGEGY
jgi:hypothetical protein